MTALRWGPRPATFAAISALAAAGGLWFIVAGSTEDRLVAGAVSIAGLISAALLLRIRTRLTASLDGLRVGTVAGVVTLAWHQVRGIEVVTRRRWGTSSQLLEVDLDDDGLLIFGRFDLGTDPAEVAAAISELRTGRR